MHPFAATPSSLSFGCGGDASASGSRPTRCLNPGRLAAGHDVDGEQPKMSTLAFLSSGSIGRPLAIVVALCIQRGSALMVRMQRAVGDLGPGRTGLGPYLSETPMRAAGTATSLADFLGCH